MNNIHEFIFILSFLIFFMLSIYFIQPLRVHRKRKVSTISLKVSYLLYQFMFLVFLYFLIFSEKPTQSNFISYTQTYLNPYFILFLLAAIVPNITIMIRRKIKHKRTEYNTTVTLTNVLFFLYLLVLIVVKEYTRF
jgi:uncharacterized membrane protein YhaH (DUF805 family)